MSDAKSGSDYHGFNTTMWTVVLNAGDSDSPDADSALERLCEVYWPPLYSFAYGKLKDAHEAEDVTQAFFSQLLERRDLSRLHPDRGRFRAFLLAAMKNFLSKHWARQKAQKRGGHHRIFSLDELPEARRQSLEQTGDRSPETEFDAQWAHTLVDSVFVRLREEFDCEGIGDRYELLSQHILGDPSDQDYAKVATSLGITRSAVRSAVMRIRRRFRALFREAVMQTVADPKDVEGEMRHLLITIS